MGTTSPVEAILRAGAPHHPALIALHEGGASRWSYGDVADHADRLATGLRRAGLAPGEPVLLFARNSPPWIVACLAILRAGGIMSPIDAQAGRATLTRILQDSGARWVCTSPESLPHLEAAASDRALKVILLEGDSGDPRHWRRFLAETATDLPAPKPDETAALFYTSGTTGSTKGVPLTHRNLGSQIEAVAVTKMVRSDERVLLPLPLHHVYPLVIGVLAVMALGVTLILPESLTGPQILRAIRDERVSAIIGVPRLYAALWEGLRRRVRSGPRLAAMLFDVCFGLSMAMRRAFGVRLGKALLRPLHREVGPDLRLLACGGAALDPDLAWKLEALGWQVAIGYGLTETSPLLTLNLPNDLAIGSVGRAIPGVELRLDPGPVPKTAARENGAETITGEVLARGANVFSGYRNLPEKTAQAFTPDGWFRTGDIGFFDRRNFLHLTGRLSSLIVTEGGENIQPEEIEEAFRDHPLIREIGVLQTREGRLAALVRPRLAAQEGSSEEIEARARDAIATLAKDRPSYERITEVAFTREPIARTRLGKIRRHLLAEEYERARKLPAQMAERRPMSIDEMALEDRAMLEDAAARRTWELLARRYHDKPLTLASSPQLDLGVDSLEWLNLTLEIRSHAGVELTEEAIARVDTVRDLLQETIQAGAASLGPSWLEEPEVALSREQMRWLRPLTLLGQTASGALQALNRWLVRRLFQLRIEGLENLPGDRAFVLVPNHLSYLDPAVLAVALGNQRMRQTYWGGWTGVMTTNPLNRLFSRLAHVVPIDPERAIFSSLAFGAAVLKRGLNLVWFPEGGISRSGELQPFKPGIGLLLDHFQTPAVPVAISGTGRCLPAGKVIPQRGTITVRFGKAVAPISLNGGPNGSSATERIPKALHELVARLQAMSGGKEERPPAPVPAQVGAR